MDQSRIDNQVDQTFGGGIIDHTNSLVETTEANIKTETVQETKVIAMARSSEDMQNPFRLNKQFKIERLSVYQSSCDANITWYGLRNGQPNVKGSTGMDKRHMVIQNNGKLVLFG